MNVKINAADDYTLNFEQSDNVKSVVQNVSLLLNTKRGTVPMHREFGLAMEFIDKPIDIAETIAFAEISEAIERFEPRATLVDISFEKAKDGKMTMVVEVSINDEQSD